MAGYGSLSPLTAYPRCAEGISVLVFPQSGQAPTHDAGSAELEPATGDLVPASRPLPDVR